jgi:hypothetical protein
VYADAYNVGQGMALRACRRAGELRQLASYAQAVGLQCGGKSGGSGGGDRGREDVPASEGCAVDEAVDQTSRDLCVARIRESVSVAWMDAGQRELLCACRRAGEIRRLATYARGAARRRARRGDAGVGVGSASDVAWSSDETGAGERLLGGGGSPSSGSSDSSASSSSTSDELESDTSGSEAAREGTDGKGARRTCQTEPSRAARHRRRRRRLRGRESMSDLLGRYDRYAQQIDRLVGKRGKKWKRVEGVRRRQRRCMLQMLSFPAAQLTRALRRVQAVVCTSEAELVEYETGEVSTQVYVHVNPRVRSAY